MKKITLLLLSCFLILQVIQAGFINGTIRHGFYDRVYSIYVPDIYTTKNIKVPLLLGLHGYGDDVENFKNICMTGIADTANYICVYAEGLPFFGGNAWNSGAGSGIINVNSDIDDVGFLNKLIDTVIANYKIDTSRMYVFGFSFGAFMTDRLAAQNTKRFAAVANVSGLRGNFLTAIPTAGMPYLKFHGTKDPTINYEGTQTIGFLPGFGLSAENTVKFWVTQNQCNPVPVIDTMPDLAADGKRFVRFSYNNGRDNSKTIFYKVLEGEHKWYGTPTNDISYCQTIWAFFRQYSRQSTITSIKNSIDRFRFSIYPNPSNGQVTLDFSSLQYQKVNRITVYDITGNLVDTRTIKNELIINLEHSFSPGMYIVEISGEDGVIASEKIIVN